MILKVKKVNPLARVPEYATDGSGAFDFYSDSDQYNVMLPRLSHVFSTGIAVEIPKGHVLLLFSRSGHGFKDNIRLANCVGVIDSDYRGEIKIKLTSDSPMAHTEIPPYGRIAQGIIFPIPKVQIVEVDELSSTERGEGGFGSTGV